MFYFGRLCVGVGGGISSVVAPSYISTKSLKSIRLLITNFNCISGNNDTQNERTFRDAVLRFPLLRIAHFQRPRLASLALDVFSFYVNFFHNFRCPLPGTRIPLLHLVER